jgi:hypothetical protein
MQSNHNPFLFPLVAIAIVLGSLGLYIAQSKRACECPRPSIHDRDDRDRDQPRRRRPDGATGTTGEAVGTECPDGKCIPKDTNGVVKRDM